MTIKEFYNTIGGNYDDVLARLMNDMLIKRLLGKYLDDTNCDNLVKNIENGDMKEAFMSVHTLKGLALNLGFVKLGEDSTTLTEYLRAGGADVSKAEAFMKPIVEEHKRIVQLIKQLD